ncbi:MAG: adenylate/guanylate cyclase domain-containing protein [Oligoflexia bacterium]|nr:adenylate/guanylate cyclase domain-containing protein [Oligoflexia bacterium]
MKEESLNYWLRPAGALLITLVGFLLIALSVSVRESRSNTDHKSRSFKDALLFSSSFTENWFYDLRTARFYDHKEKSPNLVVLEISDASLNEIGRWPWTRSIHGKILDNLKTYGAKVVMFDALFPEPESPQADQAFADAIINFSSDNQGVVVLGYGLTQDPSQSLENAPDELQLSAISGRPGSTPMRGRYAIDRLNFAAPGLILFESNYGFISAEADIDGVFRHMQLVNEIDSTFFPSLGFSGFNSFYSNGKDRKLLVEGIPNSADYNLKISSEKEERTIRLNPHGELKVRFFGGPESFHKVAIEDVYLDKNPSENENLKGIFGGRAVLIGSSAFGAHDLRHTPVSPQTPGMYMHANLFHALDTNTFFRSEDENMLYSFLLYFLGIISVMIFARLKDPMIESLGALFLVSIIFAVDYFYFAPEGYFIRLFFCLNGVIALYAWFTLLNVFKEAKEKKKIRDAFSRYVAPEIVKEMLSNPDKLKVGGEKKEITMIFSDVRDFTTISERLTPQELSTLLNIYMGKMTDILFETGGTLDKYIGDALVGFWGAPLDIKDHAYQAVRGAKLMLEALPDINKEFQKRKFPQVNVGIGLNTGEVSVGNMGSDSIFQYTALGDHMNLASRLEGLTKYYGVNLMISQFTHEKMGNRVNEFLLRPLDQVQVKGKSEAVKIYEVIPNWSPWAKQDALLEGFRDAYETKFLKRKFTEAIKEFEKILTTLPEDKTTKKLLDEAKGYLTNPPPEDWTGVTIYTTK